MGNKQEIDQRFFNFLVDLAHAALDRGYAKAWFTWIEWTFVSSAILLLGKKVESGFMILLAYTSFAILFFISIAALENFAEDIAPIFKRNKILFMFVYLSINLFGFCFVFKTLKEFLT